MKKNSPFPTKRGFSLIELLVVISIMGIIMAVAAASFTTAQKRGRDARRRGDMQAVQKGFEQYYAENTNAYAACATMGSSTQFPAGLPTDPRNATPYTYSGTCSATAYCYCARMETDGSGNSSNTSCSFTASGNYFCVSNLQ